MVRTFMSHRARQELLVRVAPRYQDARGTQKSRILDEFVASTGYARKYAIRLLHGPVRAPAPIQRVRAPRYGPAVRDALTVAWSAANGICAKRLVPFLPELLPTLERHGYLQLDAEVRTLLLSLSPATADRLLRPVRQADQPRGLSTTKPGRLLKHQVPVRTCAEWDDVRPGFCEADLVAHCGGNTEGVFRYTLTLTDVATGWTECLALLHRGQDAVVQALTHARRLLPFPLLGLDTDNGGEFRGAAVLAYCAETATTFTRGRVANSNDQCFVEQKNGSIVRQLVGYDRYVGEPAYRQLTELYRAVRLYVNFFQPSVKLRAKHREGSRVRRLYDPARTPFQRVVASDVLEPTTQAHLERIAHALDPVRLLRQIQTLQDALWRHAILPPSAMAAHTTPDAVRFDVGACSTADDGDASIEERNDLGGTPQRRRRYRRAPRKLGPRTYRTRPDPFAAVWDEIRQELEAQPERTAKAAFQALQQRSPGQFPDVQLRTLQRRVQRWRASVLVAFEEHWLDAEVPATAMPAPALRAVVISAGAECPASHRSSVGP
jgi:hypothetical protein